MKRRLTEDEKRRVRDRCRALESARYPGYFVDIIVNDETDENGEAVWSSLKTREYEAMHVTCRLG